MYIRSVFEANKHVQDPRQQRVSSMSKLVAEWKLTMSQALFQETEDLLEKWKHPDPYHAPTAPGGKISSRQPFMMAPEILTPRDTGSKYERNLPAPILTRKFPWV